MNLTFKIDKKYDEEMIFEFLPGGRVEDTIDESAKVLRIDKEELDNKIKKYSSDIKKIIYAVVEEKYVKILPFSERNSIYFLRIISTKFRWNISD
jgi:hypothetical protein